MLVLLQVEEWYGEGWVGGSDVCVLMIVHYHLICSVFGVQNYKLSLMTLGTYSIPQLL